VRGEACKGEGMRQEESQGYQEEDVEHLGFSDQMECESDNLIVAYSETELEQSVRQSLDINQKQIRQYIYHGKLWM
jgi:hypothetical protein